MPPSTWSTRLGTWTITAASADTAKLADGLYTSADGQNRLDDTLQDLWLLVEYTQVVPAAA
jgi:hypothetical protein